MHSLTSRHKTIPDGLKSMNQAYPGSLQLNYFIWFSELNISKVKQATVVEGDQKAPFSIATIPRCEGGRYYFPWIAPLYP